MGYGSHFIYKYIIRENCLYIKKLIITQDIMLVKKCAENENYFLLSDLFLSLKTTN